MEDTLILNRYRLLETKAHGGFSTVQIAWDTRVQRRVAIKSIPLEQDGPADDDEKWSITLENSGPVTVVGA